MYRIPLPMSAQTKLFGPMLIGLSLVLVLICPIAWPWRLPAVACLLVCGLWLWRRFLRRRPLSLGIGAGGELSCTCADGRTLEISRVLPGILHPGLITVRLESVAGAHRYLLVPGDAISSELHWKLRRALVGFRPDQSDLRRGT